MMMAQDSLPSPDDIGPETRAELLAVLERFAEDGVDSTQLRGLLRRAAEEARTAGMRPERLLVLLKTVWNEIPPVRDARDSREKSQLLQQLVTICIKSYYA